MKNCSVEGCDNEHLARGYCSKHYKQFKRHGKILERTRYDVNEIIIKENYAEIILYNNKNEESGKALIDIEDIEKVKQYKWFLNSNDYVVNNKIGSLHRFIMNPPDDMVVDHINHNKFDNRKENLRICTHQENDWNKGIIKTNTSGVTGVIKTQWNTWQSCITVNDKKIVLGSFKTKEEAIKSRKEAEIKYFGEYSFKE